MQCHGPSLRYSTGKLRCGGSAMVNMSIPYIRQTTLCDGWVWRADIKRNGWVRSGIGVSGVVRHAVFCSGRWYGSTVCMRACLQKRWKGNIQYSIILYMVLIGLFWSSWLSPRGRWLDLCILPAGVKFLYSCGDFFFFLFQYVLYRSFCIIAYRLAFSVRFLLKPFFGLGRLHGHKTCIVLVIIRHFCSIRVENRRVRVNKLYYYMNT